MLHFSHPYMTTGKNVALTIQTFVGKVMSLLFNMLSRLVIAFLPKNSNAKNVQATAQLHSSHMTNLDSILKRRDSTLPTKARLVKTIVFPVVMYGCESWTIRKAEH